MSNISEGIVVYCKKGNILFSSNGDLIDNKNQSVRKHKINKNIIHPEFEEMKKFTDEEYWINFLTKFSKNIFPKNFKYLNNTVYYKITAKKNRNECFIDKDSIENSFLNLQWFLKEKGFLSKKEKEMNDELVKINDEEDEKVEINSWKDVYNEDFYITEFIIDMKEKYSLVKEECGNLESVLKMGLYSEFFNSENIVIKNEKIDHIKNLVWDKEKRKFSVDTTGIKFKKKSEKKEQNKIFTSYTIESSEKSDIFFSEIENVQINKKFLKLLELVF